MDRKQLVVVDDDPELLASIQAPLEEHGYEVRGVTDWRGLLRLLNQGPLPDLIVLDVMMPEFNGFELLATLKCKPSCNKVPVLVISAMGQQGRDRALAHGAADYLAKPFTMDELLRHVQEVLLASAIRPLPPSALTAVGLRARLEDAAAALEGVEKATLTVHVHDPALLDAGQGRRAIFYPATPLVPYPTVIEASSFQAGPIEINIRLATRPATAAEIARLGGAEASPQVA